MPENFQSVQHYSLNFFIIRKRVETICSRFKDDDDDDDDDDEKEQQRRDFQALGKQQAEKGPSFELRNGE